MVDITKLRIGNYIYKYIYGCGFNPIGGVLVQISLEIFHDIIDRPFAYGYADVTEKWVLSNGFERFKHGEFELYKKNFFIIDDEFNVVTEGDNKKYIYVTDVTRMHEFQNAYLLFTGKELD